MKHSITAAVFLEFKVKQYRSPHFQALTPQSDSLDLYEGMTLVVSILGEWRSHHGHLKAATPTERAQRLGFCLDFLEKLDGEGLLTTWLVYNARAVARYAPCDTAEMSRAVTLLAKHGITPGFVRDFEDARPPEGLGAWLLRLGIYKPC